MPFTRVPSLLLIFLASLPTIAQTSSPRPDNPTWIGTWAAAPSAVNNDHADLSSETTLREIVHISRGGSSVRVTFTNELGTDPLTITGAHLGIRAQGNSLVSGSDQKLTFGGESSIVIPPGAVALSDALRLTVAPLSDLAITLWLPAQPLQITTAHYLGLQTNYQATGDQLANLSLEGAITLNQWRFLKNVEVAGVPGDGAIVTLGDSITDGYGSTPDTNRRWPDELARRLQADPSLNGLAVLNAGISGNRILHNGAGPNALARFDRDVLSQNGVRYLIVLEAINDIGNATSPKNPKDPVTAEQVIVGLGQLIDRAHSHGIKVYGATLTPFVGAGYESPTGEEMRQSLNTWIRTSGRFDAVIDFDKLTSDPAHPTMFLPAYDLGDHLHPSDAGYKAMGDSIDLKLFSH